MLVKSSDFKIFLKQLLKENVSPYKDIVVPARAPDLKGNNTLLVSLRDEEEMVLDNHRAIDPVKLLFYHSRERVSNTKYQEDEYIIAGIKACDLKALQILDTALINDDFIDPAYKHWRNHTTIISSDCTTINENCHCNLLGGKPYPTSGFDLNLSKIDDNYFLTTASEKGELLIDLLKKHIPVLSTEPDTRAIIDQNRESVISELKTQNSRFSHSQNYFTLKNADSLLWEFESSDCIGCGACTNICPTCYCLILNDEGKDKQFLKVRSYDSCQLNGYARVAGGGTPRPKMYQRFRNRYLCKFNYMQSNFDEPGCTGCGRCIDTCPAAIDFRQVVNSVSNHKEIQPEHVSSDSEVEVQI